MSVQEKIKKAEEIYYRRKGIDNQQKYAEKEQFDETKKDIKLLTLHRFLDNKRQIINF